MTDASPQPGGVPASDRVATGAPAVDVGALLDHGRWSRYQLWVVLLVATTIVLDGIDNQLLGIVIPTVMAEWGLPRGAFAPVLSLGYAGMMLGGAIAGFWGDRVGRRTALLWSVAVFGVMTLATVFVRTTYELGALRLLAGFGLGGAMPNAAALAAEFAPLRQRPIAVTITIVCVPLGATLAGVLGIRLLPSLGWRMLFATGGLVPLVVALLLIRLLPESPRFLVRFPHRWSELRATLRRAGHRVADETAFTDPSERAVTRVALAELFSPAFRRDTIPLWMAFFSCLLAVYLCFSWLTTLFTSAGFAPGTANTGITAFNLGGVAGALCGGWAIARIGSRAAMLTMTALAVAGAAGLSLQPIAAGVALLPIIAMLAFTGAMINGVQTTMFALAAHVYPSAMRATGVGSAVSFGRSGAIVSGYTGAWILEYGHGAFFGMIAVSMAVAFVSLALVRRHVTSRPEVVRP